MSELASIFLTGQTLPGFVKEDVISALARLLGTDEGKAASLLSGRETLIKRHATPSDVERYIQALRKAGAAARAVQATPPSAFPTLFENVEPPDSAPSARVSKQELKKEPPQPQQEPQQEPQPQLQPQQEPKPVSQLPQELALAPGWSKPGEEQAALPPARMEPANGTGLSRSASPSSASRQKATESARDDNVYAPVYAEVPVFGLSTQGRIGRLRYMAYFWPSMGLMVGAAILAAVFIPAMAPAKPGIGMIVLAILFAIVLLWMSVRTLALRLHDMNRSGKWALVPIFVSAAAGASGSPSLIMMAPAAFWILSIALMVWPGSWDDNDYGPPPAPNTEWIYIGAALFVAFFGFGVVETLKYDGYAKSRFFEASGEAADNSSREAKTDAFMQNYAQQLDAQTPVMMGPMLKLDKVEYKDKVLRYQATIQGRGFMISDEEKDELKKSLLNSYCHQSKEGNFFPSNKVPVDFIFRYQVTAWDYDSFTLKLTPERCMR